MGDWPRTSGSRVTAIGLGSSSDGVTVTGSATLNTKGAWAQLVASTAHYGSAIILSITQPNLGAGTYLLDIGIGGAGSESVVIADILFSGHLASSPSTIVIPMHIPAGSRVAARLASATASVVAKVSGHILTGGFDRPTPRSGVTTYGANAATSSGVQVDPGGTINTKGSWTQLVSATTQPIKELMVAFGNQGNTTAATSAWLFDIGVGGSGSEQILIPDYRVIATTAESVAGSPTPCIPVSIPVGSRLAARCQCSINDASDRLLDVIMYGVI